jgi:hypothetical protein
MKKSIFYIALFIPSFLFISAKKVQALPFKENCASLQAYFNKGSWNPPTKFSGFEKVKIESGQGLNIESNTAFSGYYQCHPGYVTETSPMGTRICRATLIYWTEVYNKLEWKPDHCRWK